MALVMELFNGASIEIYSGFLAPNVLKCLSGLRRVIPNTAILGRLLWSKVFPNCIDDGTSVMPDVYFLWPIAYCNTVWAKHNVPNKHEKEKIRTYHTHAESMTTDNKHTSRLTVKQQEPFFFNELLL